MIFPNAHFFDLENIADDFISKCQILIDNPK